MCDECSSFSTLAPLHSPLHVTQKYSGTDTLHHHKYCILSSPFFPLHLTLNMKHEHVSVSLILRHLYASHHCCVSSWLGGSQLDAQHTRALAYLRLPQPQPNPRACLWDTYGVRERVTWLYWWGVKYVSCLPLVIVVCRRLCQGKAGCWVPQSACDGPQVFCCWSCWCL